MIWSWQNFDWPTTVTVGAAWVQAIGSVAAIVAAIWIARGQSREADRRRSQHHAEAVTLARELVASGDKRLTALVNSAMGSADNQEVLREIEVIALQSAADALARIPIELLLPAHNARAATIAENRLRIAADILRRGSADIRAIKDRQRRVRMTRDLAAPLATHLVAIRAAHSAMDGGPPEAP